MPPKKNAKKAAAAISTAPPLVGCSIALGGSFGRLSQANIANDFIDLGANFDINIGARTTHLIASQTDFDKQSIKVKAAQTFGIPILHLRWLHDCQRDNVRQPVQPFHVLGYTPPTIGVPSPPTHAAAARPTGAKASRKRQASSSDSDTSTKAQPAAKKAKTKDQATQLADKAEVANGQIARSYNIQIPLDEGCPLSTYTVFIDDDDLIWDASLNQTVASSNSNKFYRIQLVHSGKSDYKTWTRWGRVGERGQTKLLGDGSLLDASRCFGRKFKEKTGLHWDERASDPAIGKYIFIERSYKVDSDGKDGGGTGSGALDGEREKYEPPASTLSPPVQKLVGLIFNQSYFAAAMTDLNYDANKLPLGKLSKTTVTRGFQALKELSALLDEGLTDATEDLSNLFYSLIPHAFGRSRPPIIRDYAMLKKEITLLESLSDMKDAELIMKVDRAEIDDIHPLDRQYQGLGMREMTPLKRRSSEFRELSDYLTKTRASTHDVNYVVEDIFRIERQGEQDRFRNVAFAGPPNDRRLLWHGSRVTNFGGILSQGLRIAPPEAPVSGYMFGKGIYLADMSSKSANYCCPHISGGTALLLLCEAELGDQKLELVGSSYTAEDDAKDMGLLSTWGQGKTGPPDWKDARCVHKDLAGVRMPDVFTEPRATNVPDSRLRYNEYIVYDVAQVRLRYLFRVKM